MSNIIKNYSIDELNNELKLHILELNISFVKKHKSFSSYSPYPKYPETYDNIVFEISYNKYIIYGQLQLDTSNITYSQLLRFANCLIDKNGHVIKNRYGDIDIDL